MIFSLVFLAEKPSCLLFLGAMLLLYLNPGYHVDYRNKTAIWE
ncbi:hypothetical protein BBD26_0521 [Lactobacillus delbrueckii subsp. bulgaricus]|nr:hypothetical protein BBD26_0521 [Lactobacillus delbrueckii subsp. bulgaricus]